MKSTKQHSALHRPEELGTTLQSQTSRKGINTRLIVGVQFRVLT